LLQNGAQIINGCQTRGYYSPRIELQAKNAMSEMNGEITELSEMMSELSEMSSELSEMLCEIKCEIRCEMTEM
jgi:methyl-accepting chemotaxis protein